MYAHSESQMVDYHGSAVPLSPRGDGQAGVGKCCLLIKPRREDEGGD